MELEGRKKEKNRGNVNGKSSKNSEEEKLL